MLILIAQAAETTAEAGGLGALGISWTSLLFQVVNFAIVLFILQRFAYKPIVKILQDRRRTIEESLKNAAEIAETKKQLSSDKSKILADAHTEASAIVQRGQEQAKNIVIEAEQAATERMARFLAQGQAQLETEVSRAKQSLKTEMVSLVSEATARLIQQKMDPKSNAKLVKESLEAVEEE